MFRRKHRDEDDSFQRDAKVKELRVAVGPLSGRISKFCTDACLVRYLEARNWNVDKAKKMLEDTIKWRTNYKPEEIRWNEVAHEGETGKVSRASFKDRLGRSVLILRPAKQNTTSPEGNILHLVYMIENAILNLPEGQGQMSWLIDFTGWSLANSVPVKTTRETINILQNHYPERLGVAFLYNPPRIFGTFWKIVKYFLDERTFQKVKFVYPNKTDSVEVMKSHFDIENLPAEFGGNASLDYNHEEFSKQMIADDGKADEFWGVHVKPSKSELAPELVFHSSGHSRAEVAPEPDFLLPISSN